MTPFDNAENRVEIAKVTTFECSVSNLLVLYGILLISFVTSFFYKFVLMMVSF